MAYASDSRTSSVSFGTRMSEVFFGLFEGYRAWRQYRRTLNELQGLSARELADLGLNADSIKAAAFDATFGKTNPSHDHGGSI